MQFSAIIVAALSAVAVASPTKMVDARQTALTSCPANAPWWAGSSTTTDSQWDNVCCEYTTTPGGCCLLDVSKGGVDGYTWLTEACSTFVGTA